jgi:hypothetical protein
MRSERWVTGILSVLLVLVVAAPAGAAGAGWLERLSGPGPFFGFELFPVPLASFGGEEGFSPLCMGCPGKGRGTWIVSFTFSTLDTTKNSLPYDLPASVDRTVNLDSYAFSLDLRLHKAVDVGVGLAFNRFHGQPFDAFTRVSIDPEIVIRPIAFFLHDSRTATDSHFYLGHLLQLKLREKLFLGGFDASDFGSPGTFHVSSEFRFGCSFGLGLSVWF